MSKSPTGGAPVSIREETMVIPTYPAPAPEPNPMFFEKRVNQGASGRVYPNPVTDRLSDERVDRPYQMVILENEYVQVMVLPEIGGRIFAGLDKTNNYDFFYRQHVIKPALIGLFGSWMSGGVEFNWPMHHRPGTFLPTDYFIEEGEDGSRTVWLSEHDPMEHTKGMVGVCLYPGKAIVETKVRLFNRTSLPTNFLWWENAAVYAADDYQTVFPPDVNSITFHTRQFEAAYPIAVGEYAGLDFGDGTDISWYHNIPQATSYFANASDYNFFGGYDHGKQAGVIHIANHHISPGKKMFTWGNGEFGKAWERNLTDADGPYLELMAGVYTDNQPDFSWIQPYEAKVFSQYWYPVQQIGASVNANLNLAISLHVADGVATVGASPVQAFPGARILLTASDQAILDQQADIAPGAPFVASVALPAGVEERDLLLRVFDASGAELIRYAAILPMDKPIPDPMNPPPAPGEAVSTEELYLAGLHLEQYRHATWAPELYWEEALRRDPGDVRNNNALGRLWLRRGDFARAEAHFRKAIETLTRWNFNPYDGEPYYNLGLALAYQDRLDEAYAAFYKGIWSYAWQAAGYYALAAIDVRRDNLNTALDHLDRSLLANGLNQKAANLKAAVLRHLGQPAEGLAMADATLARDPLDFWARNERVLALQALGDDAAIALARLNELMRDDPQTYLDIAFDYAEAGLWAEADALLARHVTAVGSAVYPMILYARGYLAARRGDIVAARDLFREGAQAPTDYCFPSRLHEQIVLEVARALAPDDPRAPYYLGNLLYDKRRYEAAIAAWEDAARLDPSFSIPLRNLGFAYYNVRRSPQKAGQAFAQAFAANSDDARLAYELDQFRKHTGVPPAERLAALEQIPDLLDRRDDLAIEYIALLNHLGRPEQALERMRVRRFHPWEGGETLIATQYDTAHWLLGRAALTAGDPATALAHLKSAHHYPANLGVARFRAVPTAYLRYAIGLARAAAGDASRAQAEWQAIVDAPPITPSERYYHALALRKLGDEAAARGELEELLAYAEARMAEPVTTGYFENYAMALSLFEEDADRLNRIEATYLIGLALLGLGRIPEARAKFEAVLMLDPNHMPSQHELDTLPPS
jgi:tetratricopeptide (TPR) repeat protein